MKATVFAIPGGHLSGRDLRRDMGDPDWVDHYLDRAHPWDLAVKIESITDGPIVLIGYSVGGSLIGHMSLLLGNIVGVVVYESPLIGVERVGGDFPVLWIENDYKSTWRREAESLEAFLKWFESHSTEVMVGEGRHVRLRFGWPPFGHAWDVRLNTRIAGFVREVGSGHTNSPPTDRK